MNEKMTKLLQQTEAWIEAHHDEFVKELQDMTRIPSISRADLAEPGAPFGPDCRKMLDYALERGRYYGFETMDHEGYAGSICYGDPDNALGLFAHLDVVPVGDGWIYPPFDGVYLPEHDAIIGRGCDDNKCAAVACLFVMRMLREFQWPLKHGVRLFCGTSEETGMQDMKALVDKGFRFPKLSLVPDAGFPVNHGQKGSANGDISISCEGNLIAFDAGSARNMIPDTAVCVLAADIEAVKQALAKLDEEETKSIAVEAVENGTKLTATGRSGHAMSPGSALNAIMLLSRTLSKSGLLEGSCANAVEQLYQLTSDFTGNNEGVAYRDDMSGPLTIAYSVANLVDGILTIKADCRTPITCDVVKLEQDLIKAWEARGFKVERSGYSKPYYIPVDDPNVVALQELFHEITGRDDKPNVMGGGNYARVIPNAISFGPGMSTKKRISDFLPAGHGGCHGKDEAIVMEKVFNLAKIYVLAVALMDTKFE